MAGAGEGAAVAEVLQPAQVEGGERVQLVAREEAGVELAEQVDLAGGVGLASLHGEGVIGVEAAGAVVVQLADEAEADGEVVVEAGGGAEGGVVVAVGVDAGGGFDVPAGAAEVAGGFEGEGGAGVGGAGHEAEVEAVEHAAPAGEVEALGHGFGVADGDERDLVELAEGGDELHGVDAAFELAVDRGGAEGGEEVGGVEEAGAAEADGLPAEADFEGGGGVVDDGAVDGVAHRPVVVGVERAVEVPEAEGVPHGGEEAFGLEGAEDGEEVVVHGGGPAFADAGVEHEAEAFDDGGLLGFGAGDGGDGGLGEAEVDEDAAAGVGAAVVEEQGVGAGVGDEGRGGVFALPVDGMGGGREAERDGTRGDGTGGRCHRGDGGDDSRPSGVHRTQSCRRAGARGGWRAS
ncbi:MAG: hypothetical protein H6705_08685 [Myxococcales bacterium]|nr:hypothetical protein [Myxococcales bacterium]